MEWAVASRQYDIVEWFGQQLGLRLPSGSEKLHRPTKFLGVHEWELEEGGSRVVELIPDPIMAM